MSPLGSLIFDSDQIVNQKKFKGSHGSPEACAFNARFR
jgi:hypothetical protein